MLSIRAMTPQDAAFIADYFCLGSPEYFENMGIDPKKIPNRESYFKSLLQLIETPKEKAKAFYSVWLIDGEPVGHSGLKDIIFGEFGSQHLHLWKTQERGKGYGAKLFCLSSLDFYDRFSLKKLICEPRASNLLPNRMLAKIGFPKLGSRVAASSEISQVCELNTYAIEKETAKKFLSDF